MGSVWVCYFPSCTIFPCRQCKLSPTHLLQPSASFQISLLRVRASQTTTTTSTTRTRTRFSLSTFSLSPWFDWISMFPNSAISRFRKSRRLKSDSEICNDIRQFLDSVGLPEDHIPSTKELLLHGWSFHFPSKFGVFFTNHSLSYG